MKPTARLVLKREDQGALSPEDLAGVVGAHDTTITQLAAVCAVVSLVGRACDNTCCSCTAVSDTQPR